MKKNTSLSFRIFLGMAIVGLFPLLVITIQGYYWLFGSIEQDEMAHLRTILESRLGSVKALFSDLQHDFVSVGASNCIKGLCGGHSPPSGRPAPLCHMLDAIRERENFYKRITTFDENWRVIAESMNKEDAPASPPSEKARERLRVSRDLMILGDLIFQKTGVLAEVGQSMLNKEGKVTAYVLARVDITRYTSFMMSGSKDLGKTGKLYVLSVDGRYVLPPLGSEWLIGEKAISSDILTTVPDGSIARYVDWRGVPVLGATAPFPQIELLTVAEIDEAEVFALLRYLRWSIGIAAILTLLVIMVISARSAKGMALPLRNLAGVAKNISGGRYNERMAPSRYKEIQEVGKAFNQMLDRLEVSRRTLAHHASLAAVGELSSSIAHEIRSPLSSIRLTLETLDKQTYLEASDREMVTIATEQMERLETMLAELLKFSKPLILKPEKTLFRVLGQDVIHAVFNELEQKKLTLHVDDQLGENLLFVDRELLVRALTNIVNNAAQWSPPGGNIIVSGKKIPDRESWFSIQVIDEGPGIKENHRKRLFQPFFTTRDEGTGLGLANAKKIVEYHGGTIFAENGSRKGTTFTIELLFRGFLRNGDHIDN